MEFGAIKDTQIRASSEWDLNHAAIQGRLNFQKSGIKQGAWSSRNNDNNQWLQIDLRQSYTKVTAVGIRPANGLQSTNCNTVTMELPFNTTKNKDGPLIR